MAHPVKTEQELTVSYFQKKMPFICFAWTASNMNIIFGG